MNCPFCLSNQLSIINSRPTKSFTQVWRRRKCLSCKESFSTYERINLSYLTVEKKSGDKQRFSRAKLYSGIYHSMLDKKHADRGDLSVLTEKITSEIEESILKLKKKIIKSTEIKHFVQKALAEKSPDAFLRFVAYRDSDSIPTMKKNVKKYL